MNCDEIRPTLFDYVMEEVPPEDRPAIAGHLETCAGCSGEVGRMRQTLGLMTSGVASEDIPQNVRMVAEPAAWWVGFWRNPARLAFAGGALACLAIALLALARTSIDYQDGNFRIAFGAAVATDQSPAAAPAPMLPANNGPTLGQSLTRDEVMTLISQAVAESERGQAEQNVRVLRASMLAYEEKAEANRMNDRRELAETFRYIQAAQMNLWKQQVENQQVVSSLLQRTATDSPSRP